MKNKTALITGSASGLGYEFAKIYAAKNYQLVLIDINKELLSQVKSEIETNYQVKVFDLVINLSDRDACESIIDFTNNQNLEINVLINNAGYGVFGKYFESDWEREKNMITIHVTTTAHLTKHYLPKMINQGEGAILNVSSLASFTPGPLMAMYYSTKAFVTSFTQSIAREHKGMGVKISVLCPGITRTGFQKAVSDKSESKLSKNMASAEQVAQYGVDKMEKGKVIIVPGFKNKLLATLPRFFTPNAARNIMYNLQSKNRDE